MQCQLSIGIKKTTSYHPRPTATEKYLLFHQRIAPNTHSYYLVVRFGYPNHSLGKNVILISPQHYPNRMAAADAVFWRGKIYPYYLPLQYQ
jgi:hypothetical protein